MGGAAPAKPRGKNKKFLDKRGDGLYNDFQLKSQTLDEEE